VPEGGDVNILLLKRLRYQVLSDLDKFVPKGQFKTESSISYNGKELSKDEKWGLLALSLAGKLYDNAESHIISISPRQAIAIELLHHLGNLASIEYRNITEPEESEVINDLRTLIKEYLVYLPEQEPFISLLDLDTPLEKQLLELANNTAEAIRTNDTPVTLNTVCKKLTKMSIRDKNQRLLWGQKGWHELSWLKSKLKGWEDPILKK
jgi:hypothetical protein